MIVAATLALGAAALPAAAQEPRAPVSDPTLPSTVHPVNDPRVADLPVPASLLQDPQTEPPDRFRPVDELPPEDRLPAAPLLISAYAFVLLALFAYVLSVARRLTAVQVEVERLEREIKKSGRA
jgi:CcmD family protein